MSCAGQMFGGFARTDEHDPECASRFRADRAGSEMFWHSKVVGSAVKFVAVGICACSACAQLGVDQTHERMRAHDGAAVFLLLDHGGTDVHICPAQTHIIP